MEHSFHMRIQKCKDAIEVFRGFKRIATVASAWELDIRDIFLADGLPQFFCEKDALLCRNNLILAVILDDVDFHALFRKLLDERAAIRCRASESVKF